MSTFQTLLRLHLTIAFRYAKKLHREIAACIVLISAMETLGAGDAERNFAPLILNINLSGILLLQVLRKDKPFLRTLLPSLRRFFIAENVTLSLPLALVLVATGSWHLAVVDLFGAAVIGLFTWSFANGSMIPRKLQLLVRPRLPKSAFEWRAGLRSRWPVMLIVYVGGILFSSSGVIPLIALIAFAFLAGSLYDTSESELMLDALTYEPDTFFRRRIFQAWLLYLAVASPFIVLTVLHIHVHWYLIPIVLGYSLLFIAGAIFLKYAFFAQGQKTEFQSSVRMSILWASMLFFPLTIFYEYTLYRRARRTLPMLSRGIRSHA